MPEQTTHVRIYKADREPLERVRRHLQASELRDHSTADAIHWLLKDSCEIGRALVALLEEREWSIHHAAENRYCDSCATDACGSNVSRSSRGGRGSFITRSPA